MNVDATMIKQLLQLQLLNKMSLITSGKNSTETSAAEDDFSSILQGVLAKGDGGSQTDAGNPLAPLAALSASSMGTSSASALSGLLPSYQPYRNDALNSPKTSALRGYEDPMPYRTAGQPNAYDPLIQRASKQFGVDSSLVKAVIHQESSFNPHAVSTAGAKGLMQLMDGTGEGYGVTDPFDPQQNVHAGTQFLAGLIRKYDGNEGVALAAYNAGPGRVDRLGIRTDADLASKLKQLPQETQQYINRVLSLKDQYAASKMG